MKYILYILAAVALVAVTMFVFRILFTDVGLVIEAQPDALRIKHDGATLLKKEDFLVSYSEVTQVELLESLPTIRKGSGLNNSKVKIGTYHTADLGDFRAYAKLKQGPHLVIYTSQKTYVVTPEDARSVFEALKARNN